MTRLSDRFEQLAAITAAGGNARVDGRYGLPATVMADELGMPNRARS